MDGRVVVVTGGGGLLGVRHAEIIAAAGGSPVLVDIDEDRARRAAEDLAKRFGVDATHAKVDIADEAQVGALQQKLLEHYGRVDVLINNAANNPKVEGSDRARFARAETFSLEQWEADLDVGLKGAFICTRIFGAEMARRRKGVVVNVLSEYGLDAPDQRLYRVEGLPDDQQPVKPVTYTVAKSGLLGMSRYFASYWGAQGVRVNSITIGGVYNGQPEEFVKRYVNRVPLGRMAASDDYQGAMLFLCSDASRFMTGSNLIIDGGKSCW
jgi:NAD(P)-dependent dehydrogenase (short-subunit alcohol dehydrogenase family)